MLNKELESMLNKQIALEGYSSFVYLSMASWCEMKGFEGSTKFLYNHFEEEKAHMLKFFDYINDRGGHALAPEIKGLKHDFSSLKHIFEEILKHEQHVTAAINKLVEKALELKDFTTFSFLQWFVEEQREEENLVNTILDKFRILGPDEKNLYFIDKELGELSAITHTSTEG